VATTPEGRRLTEQHRRAQIANEQGFLAQFLAAWALLDLADLDFSTPNWLRVVMWLIDQFRQDSANLSLEYARRYRAIEVPDTDEPFPDIEFDRGNGPRVVLDLPRTATWVPRDRPGRPRNRIPLRKTGRQVPLTIRWRDRDPSVEASLRITGPVNIKQRIKAGEPPERAKRLALVEASGAAGRMIGDGGRDSLLTVVQNDRVALGWIRVTAANPCAFCAMLSSRGISWGRYSPASFRESDEKFRRDGDPRFDDAGNQIVRVHSACRCTLQPVYYENDRLLSASKEYRDLWNAYIRGSYGGKDAILAWRRLYERPDVFKRKLGEIEEPERRAA
jgi:hypothetical protein